jgi:hypothetical protein
LYPAEIIESLEKAIRILQEETENLKRLGEEKSVREAEYRKALAKEILILRDEKMSVTLIGDISRGNVADLKMRRDVADSLYDACKENIKTIRVEIETLRSLLAWQKEELKNA